MFVFLPFLSFGQLFQLFDVDDTNYPEMKAKFISMDKTGNTITNTKPQDVIIKQNGEDVRIINLQNPEKAKIQPISVVLTIDVSGSMSGTNVELAKEAARTFVALTPLEISEIAITTFDSYNYLNQDFTRDPDRLYAAIDAIDAQGGTNYNFGFAEPSAGGLNLAKRGLNKKVVIFLTDGLGDGNTSEIIRTANKNDITAYCITVNMPMPDILRDIALQTGGQHYENVNTIEDAKKIYVQILQSVQNSTFGEITWLANPACSVTNKVTIDFNNLFYEFTYQVAKEQTIGIQSSLEFVNFGIIPVGDSIQKTIKLKALNDDIEILDVSNTNTDLFKIINFRKTPFLLKKNKSVNLTVRFIPEEEGLVFSRIDIETDKCKGKAVFVNGGNPGLFSSRYKSTLKVKSPNGGEVLIAGTDNTIEWEGVSKNDTVQIAFSDDNGNSFTKIGEAVDLKTTFQVPLTKSKNCIVRVIQKNVPIELRKINGRAGKINSAYFNKNGTNVLISTQFDNVKIINTIDSKTIQEYKGHEGDVNTAKYNSDESRIVSASDDNTAIIWDVNTGEKIKTLKSRRLFWIYFKKAHTAEINDAIFSPDGKTIITAGNDNLIIYWNAEDGKIIHKVEAHKDRINSLEFSPDSTLIVSTSNDNTMKTWNAETGELVNSYSFSSNIKHATYNSDGSILAAGDSDGFISLFDTKTNLKINKIKAHKLAVNHLSFSPDDSRIVSASFDQTAKIWDVASGKRLQTIHGYKRNTYTTAEFSPEGSRVLTASSGSSANIWSAYLAPMQRDISDTTFSVVAPIPDVVDVTLKPCFVDDASTEVIYKFFQNKNPNKVYIKKIEFRGKDASNFYIVSGFPPFFIPANSNKSIEFGFKSSEIGKKSAEMLIITSMDTVRTNIYCEAVEKPFEIKDMYVDFGKVKPYKSKTLNVVIIKNVSKKNLKIVNFKNSGPDFTQFKINSRFKGKIIRPGESLKLNATYSPLKRGQTSTALRFYLDGYSFPVTINLVGECDAPRFVKIKGIVTDGISGKNISASVTCFDKISGRKIAKTASNKKGEYSFIIPVERNYRIIASKKSYLPSKKDISLKGLFTEEVIKQDFEIIQLYSGSTVVLHINFDTGKHIIKSDEKSKLKGIISYLTEHPEQNIEISGHTDNEGDDEFNNSLSVNRATAVKKYFVSKGIEGSRITTVGYGLSKPIATNDTDEGKLENRRVEIKFIGF